jgi:RHS repeat-associated protein
LRYGNGTETDYEYNAVTRQAKRMELYTSENNATGGQIKILDKSYQYNALGMISSIANSAGHLGSSLAYNDLGGTYSFNYTYDDHGRLSSVGNSSWTGSAGTWNYNLSMTYAKDGRILAKDQGFVGPGGTPHATMDYTLSYQYGASAEVHQLTKIVEDGFNINVSYNARGGIKHIDNAKTKEHTTHVWDKDMRLRGTKNNGGLHHNVYDWMGTRLMKSTLTTATVYQNGNPTTTHSVMPYIVYAGSHYVFEMYRNDVEVSKHYFAGDERIATRLQVETRVSSTYSEPTEYTSYFGSFDPDGDGSFNPNPAPATPNNIVLDDLCRMANDLGYPLECYFLKQQLLPQYIYSIGDRDACWGEDEFNAFVFPMDMTAYCECLDPNQPNRSYDCDLYPFIYWYHHDHKGSTEFVTDLAGMAYEYSLYSPFREGLVNQSANNSGYSNPYKFKGDIYDPETGLTYNVARFYYAKWSIWTSPDPLANLRNWVTPYNYTLNNPINRIDPTGLLCKEVKTGPGDPPMEECPEDKKILLNWVTVVDQRPSNVLLKATDGSILALQLPNFSNINAQISLEDVANMFPKKLGGDFIRSIKFDGFQKYDLKEDLAVIFDLMGIFDPSPICDQISARIEFENKQYLSAGLSQLGIIPYIGDAAKILKLNKYLNFFKKIKNITNKSSNTLAAVKGVATYTKSNLQLGQQMHKAYKLRDVVEGVAIKEFRSIPGIRPDFVDFSTKTIYELKPFNPRAMKQGWKQLNKYQKLFQQQYGGNWQTVLDTY